MILFKIYSSFKSRIRLINILVFDNNTVRSTSTVLQSHTRRSIRPSGVALEQLCSRAILYIGYSQPDNFNDKNQDRCPN